MKITSNLTHVATDIEFEAPLNEEELLAVFEKSGVQGFPAELPNYDVLPIVPGYTPPSGCLSSPVESSREKGAILRNVAVKHMVEAVKHEFSGEGDYHEV